MLNQYKNRTIDLAKPVLVYKNLHNGLFSIKQGGKVVAHASDILLTDVSFKVSEAGRKRVIHERKKNVHAFVIGTIASFERQEASGVQVSYNPYKTDHFYIKPSGDRAQLTKTQQLYMSNESGLFIK